MRSTQFYVRQNSWEILQVTRTSFVKLICFDLQANPDNMNEETREYVVRARGLPWSATVENVAEFFSGKGFVL